MEDLHTSKFFMGFLDSSIFAEAKLFLGCQGGWERLLDVAKTLEAEAAGV